jgi:hypothetical protein
MSLKQTWIILLCVFGMTTASYADDRALLVGINEYLYLNSLVGSTQDVENMAQFIQSEWGYKPWQIITLTDGEATKEAILTVFDEWLIEGTGFGDKVLFYYSGHGYYLQDDNADETDGYDEALCPVDAYQSERLKVNLIRDDEIDQRLKKLKGRQVMVIVDACHSGSVTKNALGQPIKDVTVKVPIFKEAQPRPALKKNLTRNIFIELRPEVVAYSAVDSYQKALVDISRLPLSGAFTRRFIEGLRDNKADSNCDGQVNHRELLAYTRRESKAYCETVPDLCENGLTPQLDIKPARLNEDVHRWAGSQSIYSKRLQMSQKQLTQTPTQNLQVDILPRHRLKPGASMRVRVKSDRTGYVLLYDTESTDSTKLTRLFPNQHSNIRKGYIKAGKARVIPDVYSGFAIKVPKTSGKRLLVALVVDKPTELLILQKSFPKAFKQAMSKPAQPDSLSKDAWRSTPCAYGQVPRTTQTFLQQLSQQLIRTLQRSAENVKWSITTVDYEIRP